NARAFSKNTNRFFTSSTCFLPVHMRLIVIHSRKYALSFFNLPLAAGYWLLAACLWLLASEWLLFDWFDSFYWFDKKNQFNQ
ncbi:MAG: hypothetical protein KAS40_09505, partial [Desulfobacterales bacterium]|nr:hypothetical protein [Desulfobacterales bacterium]